MPIERAFQDVPAPCSETDVESSKRHPQASTCQYRITVTFRSLIPTRISAFLRTMQLFVRKHRAAAINGRLKSLTRDACYIALLRPQLSRHSRAIALLRFHSFQPCVRS